MEQSKFKTSIGELQTFLNSGEADKKVKSIFGTKEAFTPEEKKQLNDLFEIINTADNL